MDFPAPSAAIPTPQYWDLGQPSCLGCYVITKFIFFCNLLSCRKTAPVDHSLHESEGTLNYARSLISPERVERAHVKFASRKEGDTR